LQALMLENKRLKCIEPLNLRRRRFPRSTSTPNTQSSGIMAQINGTTKLNGVPHVNGHKDEPTDKEMEEDTNVHTDGTDHIPPAELHENPEHIKKITIPLNDTPAWKPRRKLRVVTIGAGYSGMILAQKLQHKYPKEMNEILDHVIYEAMDDVGGTWSVNTYPGVMCDVPSTIYVRTYCARQ
jgi:hypothetical protein